MLWMMLIGATLAGSPCKELKPKHRINPGTVALARGALQTALTYGGAPLASSALAAIPQQQSFGAIAGNEDAKAQTLYEICTMKEAGLLTAAKAEELTVLALTGRSPTTSTAPVPSSAIVNPFADYGSQVEAMQRKQFEDAIALHCPASGPAAGMEQACAQYRYMLANLNTPR